MLRIYLDNCCYNRPFDDYSIGNNFAEANSKIYIQSLVAQGKLSLIYSSVSLNEIKASRKTDNKKQILEFINNNAEYYKNTKEYSLLLEIIKDVMKTGIKLNDASHVAYAIVSKCDYLISTDKRLLKYEDRRIRIIDPITFEKIWRETNG
jgi:predicted nucleic acid-binding protein